MSLDKNPIFKLLIDLKDNSIAREVLILSKYIEVDTVEGLTAYSRPQLEGIGVSTKTLDELETRLKSDYDTQFSSKPYRPRKPSRPKTTITKPKTRRRYTRASGAPPTSLYTFVSDHYRPK